MIVISEAISSQDYQEAKSLIDKYVEFLRVDLEFQGFSSEIEDLDEMYGPPKGAMILARDNKKLIGCVGLRPLNHEFAEMKRMYVDDAYRGKGIGERLLISFLDKARQLGYQKIRLDTFPELKAANSIYRKYGFKEIAPYRYNPRNDAIFMEHFL